MNDVACDAQCSYTHRLDAYMLMIGRGGVCLGGSIIRRRSPTGYVLKKLSDGERQLRQLGTAWSGASY